MKTMLLATTITFLTLGSAFAQGDPLGDLPIDPYSQVCNHLKPRDLSALQQVSKKKQKESW